jgi:glycosyltransferase involved in cell wall biosynthesis
VKILIVNSLYPPNVRGGAELSVQSLAESLVARGTEVVVATTAGQGATGISHFNAVKVVYLPVANLYWPFDHNARSAAQRKLWHILDVYNPVMKTRLARLIRRERPTIVHTSNLQGLSVAAWYAARAERVPIVHTLQDYYLTCARCSRYRDGRNCERTCWDCLPFLLARKRASACVAGVVGVSRFILDHHRDLGLFVNATISAVIPHVSPRGTVHRKANSPQASLTFGYLGRLVPEKGIELLLDTFAARGDKGWELLIAGEADNKYSRQLQQRHADLQNRSAIRFLGWVEPVEFFNQVDVLIVPSRWQEPLARVVQEAYAYGVPVVASNRGGMPEQIEDGVIGLLFDPDDPNSLAKAVNRILEDRSLAGRLGQNVRRRAEQNSMECVVNEYRNVYRSVLESIGQTTVRGDSEAR